MKFICINPHNQSIWARTSPVPLDHTVLRQEIGNWFCLAGRLPNGDMLWVDDEGLCKEFNHIFSWPEVNTHVLAGIGILTGPEVRGKLTEPSTEILTVAAAVTFLGRAQIVREFDYSKENTVTIRASTTKA